MTDFLSDHGITRVSASDVGGMPVVSITTAAGGASLGTANTATSSIISIVAGSNITLSQVSTNPAVTIIGPNAPTATNFSLNGSSSSVSLVAGAGIGLASNASTITISSTGSLVNSIGPSGSLSSGPITISGGSNITISSNGAGVISINAPASIVNAFGISSVTEGGVTAGTTTVAQGTVRLVAGSNITLSSSGGAITIYGQTAGAAADFSLNGSSSSVSLIAGAGIGIASNASTMTISVSSAATNFSLNGSSSSVSLVAGAGIGIASNASTMTISSTGSVVNSIGAAGSLSSGPITISGGSNITISSNGAGVISINAPASIVNAVQMSGNTSGTSSLISSGTLYLQAVSMIGLSQSTTTGANSTTSNILSIFGPAYAAGAGLAVSTTGGTVSYAVSAAATNFSLNGSSSSVSLIAGAGIGIASNASTMTISSTGSVVNSIGPSGSLSSGPITISGGSNITISSNGAGVISINAPSDIINNVKMSGNTSGTSSIISSGSLILQAVSMIGLSQSTTTGVNSTTSNIISIFGPSYAAGAGLAVSTTGGTVSYAVSSAATNFSLNGSSSSVSLVAGANIAFASGASSITISASNSANVVSGFGISSSTAAGGTTAGTTTTATGNILLVAGSNMNLSSSGGAITISANVPAATNFSLNGSSSSLSLVAGAGIGLASNASTITISSTGSIVNSIGPSGSLSSGPITISGGSNITISSNGAGVISINAPSDIINNVKMSGNTSGTSSVISAGSLILQAVSMIGLSQSTTTGANSTTSNILSIFGPAYAAGAGLVVSTTGGTVSYAVSLAATNFSLNGSSSSVSLIAGAGIGFASNASTITISSTGSIVNSIGPTGSLSSGPITVSGGSNITISSNGAGVISINAPANIISGVQMSGNTSGTSSIIQGSTFILQAVSMIGLSQSTTTGANSTTSNIISVFGPAYAAGAGLAVSTTGGTVSYAVSSAATNFSLNGSSSSVSLVAGAGIGIASNASTMTISSTGSLVNSIGAAGSLSSGPITISGGSNITISSNGAGVISINAPSDIINNVKMSGNTSGTSSIISGGTFILQAVSLIGLSQSTTTGVNSTTSNIISIFGPTFAAGAGLAVSTTGGSVSYAVSSAATNFSLNGSSSSVSLIAGAGIGFASNASTITISSTGSIVNSIGPTGSLSSGPITISGGSNITISSNGAGVISINAPVSLISSALISVSGGGATSGASGAITAGGLILCAGSNITLSQTNGTSINSVTIIGAAANAAGSNTISASGTSIAGSALSFALAAGNNITLGTATAAGSMTVSITGLPSATHSLSAGANSLTGTAVSLALIAGNNISLATATGAGSLTVTISNFGQSKISFTQNYLINEIGGPVVSATGTVTGTAGFGSSLFLNRINVPAGMTLTEVDLAMGLSFPATNQGAGTLSQSFVLYSFGNTSSLASVMSFSTTYAWQTGTSTSGAVVSLTQFQGGWSVQKIHPMTFASSSFSAGEYVVGNLLNFAQGSSTWTIALLGQLGSVTNSVTISNVTSTGQTLASALTNSVGIASLGISNYEQSSNTHAGSAVSAIATNTSLSTKSFSVQARSFLTNTASVGTGTAISSLSLITQSIVPQYLTVPSLVYIGTGSTTSALPSVFVAGIMSTGGVPVAITLTSTAVTYSGTQAGAVPYYALVGS